MRFIFKFIFEWFGYELSGFIKLDLGSDNKIKLISQSYRSNIYYYLNVFIFFLNIILLTSNIEKWMFNKMLPDI